MLWYNRNWDSLFASAPSELAQLLTEGHRSWLRRAFKEKRREVKMLLHDWSQDPLVYNDPEFATAIREAQIKGLKQLLAMTKTHPSANNIRFDSGISSIVRDFLQDSGLYTRFNETLVEVDQVVTE